MSPPPAAPKQAAAISLGIEGMTCASCVRRVEKAISATPGVASSSVNLATQCAKVVFSGAPDIAAVVSAIGRAGYGTTIETARFDIDKMSCASCVNHVEKAFKKVPGVIEANVNLAAKTGTVRFVAGVTNAEALAKAATSAGYPAHEMKPDTPASSRADRRSKEWHDLTRTLVVAMVLTAPVFALEMGSHMFPAVHMLVMNTIGMQASRIAQFALIALVLFGPGRRFFTTGFPALWRGAPDMNALVALGAGAAFAHSALVTFAPGLFPAGTSHVYLARSNGNALWYA